MYKCECGKEFDDSQAFNGHKSRCKEHFKFKGEKAYKEFLEREQKSFNKASVTQKEKFKKLKEEELQQWIAEKHTCEKCGKVMTEKFGSGRFCSRACANSKVFSEEAKLKKSLANQNRKCYTNGEVVIYLKPDEKIPEGFIRGNFFNSKYDSLEEFQKQYKEIPNYKKLSPEERERRKKERAEKQAAKKLQNKLLYETNLIKLKEHNKNILNEYKNLLHKKSENKIFDLDSNCIKFKYKVIRDYSNKRNYNGYVFIHVLLAEELLDRQLNELEIVHHVNENKLDNRFDNIYIFDTKASHVRFHYSKKPYKLEIINDVLRCSAITDKEIRNM